MPLAVGRWHHSKTGQFPDRYSKLSRKKPVAFGPRNASGERINVTLYVHRPCVRGTCSELTWDMAT